MSSISKLRGRAAPIQPSSKGKGEAFHSVKKRTAADLVEDDLDVYARELEEKENTDQLDLEGGATTAVEFDPASTQTRVQECFIVSNEAKYRGENYPTIHDKMEARRIYLKKQQLEAAKKALLAEKLKKLEEKRLKEEEELRNTRGKGIKKKPDSEFKIDEGEDDVDEAAHIEQFGEIDEEYKMAMLASKERRLVNQRLTNRVHEKLSYFEVLGKQLYLYLQLAPTSSMFSQILPWLILGRGQVAQNIHSLSKLGVTHVLNVTKEIPNFFPATFGESVF